MSIGSGIFLFVVGAILAFGVRDNWDVIDLTTIGYILMGAGVLVFLLGLVFTFRSRKSVSTTQTTVDPVSGEGVTHNERSIS